MGREEQPGPFGDGERRREVRGVAATFVVAQPEADDAAAGVLRCQAGEAAGVQRMAGPVGCDDDAEADAHRLRRLPSGVEHELGELGDVAEPRGVAGRVDLELGPDGTVGGVVLERLAHEPADVVVGAYDRPGHVVQPLEPEPALLVGGDELRRPLVDEGRRKAVAVTLGELQQRRVPHRAGEVQMQVRLRKRRNRPHPAIFAAPPDSRSIISGHAS